MRARPSTNRSSSDGNQHARGYLDYFLALKFAPNYAVLLDGPWGVGKTHFIQDYLAKRFPQDAKKYLFVSLFGLKNREEISEAIVQATYPILGLKATKLGARIGKTALKHYGLDLDIKASDIIGKLKADIIVFDDLERSEMNLGETLGYINEFVEHDDCKVIIVANTKELPTDTGFSRKREKLVGKTLVIKPSFESAFHSFTGLVSDKDTQQFLIAMQSEIETLYRQSELNNLRILLQTIWDFERIFASLTREQQSNSSAMKSLLRLFFPFAFEYKAGNVLAEDIANRQVDWTYILSEGKNGGGIVEKLKKRYGSDFSDTILTNRTLQNILVEGAVIQDDVQSDINASAYFVTAKTEPAWRTVWHWAERSATEFDHAFKEMRRQFSERKLDNLGEIIQIASILYYFQEEAALPLKFDDIDQDARGYVDYLVSEDLLKKLSDATDQFSRFRSLDGLGMYPSKGFSSFIDYLKKAQFRAEEASLPQQADKLIKDMEEDAELFFRRVNLTADGVDNLYYNKPILHFLDPAVFVRTVLDQPMQKQRTILMALGARYEHGEIEDKLSPERAWLVQIDAELEKARESAASIESYRLRKFLEWYIAPALVSKNN